MIVVDEAQSICFKMHIWLTGFAHKWRDLLSKKLPVINWNYMCEKLTWTWFDDDMKHHWSSEGHCISKQNLHSKWDAVKCKCRNDTLWWYGHISHIIKWWSGLNYMVDQTLNSWKTPYVHGILPKGPYPPCLRMAHGALLARYPQCAGVL